MAKLQAFTRDPEALFLSCNSSSSSEGAVRAPQQPVLYRGGVRLRVALGASLPAGCLIDTVTVDWVGGRIDCFASTADAMNHVPLFSSLGNALPLCAQPEHADVYVRETFAFLARGHSLFEPGCRCVPPVWWDARRTASLGLTRQRRAVALPTSTTTTAMAVEAGRQTGRKRKRAPKKKKAPLLPPPLPREEPSTVCDVRCDRRGSTRSVQEIALELGVLRDLNGHVEVCLSRGPCFAPLLDVLVRLAGLVPDGIDHQTGAVLRLGSPLCCIPRAIRTGRDVEQAARVLAPRPYVYCPGEDAVTRRVIETDLNALVEQRRVRMLPSSTEGGWAIFWNGDALHLEPSDSSAAMMMRTLWNSAAGGGMMPSRRG